MSFGTICRMKTIVAAAAVALTTATWSSVALAGEALLIRHEVLTVDVGTEVDLRPGFFIGKAWTADPEVGVAARTWSNRAIHVKATAPGRTIVSAWNLREPDQRIEFEIVVVGKDSPNLTPSLLNPAKVETEMPAEATESAMMESPAMPMTMPAVTAPDMAPMMENGASPTDALVPTDWPADAAREE